jgi:hypothetical protein
MRRDKWEDKSCRVCYLGEDVAEGVAEGVVEGMAQTWSVQMSVVLCTCTSSTLSVFKQWGKGTCAGRSGNC